MKTSHVLFALFLTSACSSDALTRRSTAGCPPGEGQVETWCDDAGNCEYRVVDGPVFSCSAGDSAGCTQASADAIQACEERSTPELDGGFDAAAPPGDAGLDAGDMDGGPVDASVVPDGALDAGSDAGVSDAALPPATAVVGFGTDLAMLTAADYTCAGFAPTPAETGPETTFTGNVTDFQSMRTVDGLEIQVFRDNLPTLDGTCTGTCVSSVSSGGTISAVDNQASWFAYHVVAGSGTTSMGAAEYMDVYHFNVPARAMGGAFTVNAVARSTNATILTLLGVRADPGTAAITGSAVDCGVEDIANATIRLFRSDGSEIPLGFGASGPRQFYYNGTRFPSSLQRATHVDGLFGATNIPVPADGVIRIETWGAFAVGSAPRMLGCEEILVAPDSLSLVGVGPARAARSTACSALP